MFKSFSLSTNLLVENPHGFGGYLWHRPSFEFEERPGLLSQMLPAVYKGWEIALELEELDCSLMFLEENGCYFEQLQEEVWVDKKSSQSSNQVALGHSKKKDLCKDSFQCR